MYRLFYQRLLTKPSIWLATRTNSVDPTLASKPEGRLSECVILILRYPMHVSFFFLFFEIYLINVLTGGLVLW